jgi:hypothetical protein
MADPHATHTKQQANSGVCLKCGASTMGTTTTERDFCPECLAHAPLPLSHYYMAHYYGSFAD